MNPGQRWSAEEDAFLREHWPAIGHRCAAQLPGRSLKAIYSRVMLLGVKRRELWTPEEDALLRDVWPSQGCKSRRHFPGKTTAQIRHRASRLKLRSRWRNAFTLLDESDPRLTRPKSVQIPRVSSIFALGDIMAEMA